MQHVFVNSGTDQAALNFWASLDYTRVFTTQDEDLFKSFSEANSVCKLRGIMLLHRNKRGNKPNAPFLPPLERDSKIEDMAKSFT